MDLSPEYISMCSAAQEIQKGWEPKEGDSYAYIKCQRIDSYIEYDWEEEASWITGILGDKDDGRYFRTWYKEDKIIGFSTYFSENWQGGLQIDPVWLPRLDQLLEMMDLYLSFVLLKTFDDMMSVTIHGKERSSYFVIDTVEKGLLNCVMHQIYNKTWSPETGAWEGR